jgi:hypothetical protein
MVLFARIERWTNTAVYCHNSIGGLQWEGMPTVESRRADKPTRKAMTMLPDIRSRTNDAMSEENL